MSKASTFDHRFQCAASKILGHDVSIHPLWTNGNTDILIIEMFPHWKTFVFQCGNISIIRIYVF